MLHPCLTFRAFTLYQNTLQLYLGYTSTDPLSSVLNASIAYNLAFFGHSNHGTPDTNVV